MELDYLLVGAYGTGNFGDDALLDCLINEILSLNESSRIGVLVKPKPYLEHKYPKIEFIGRNSDIEINVDTLIYGGGTQFYSFRKKHSYLRKLKTVFSSFSLFKRKIFKKEIKISASKRLMLGIGIGPFHSDGELNKAISTLKQFDAVGLRDHKSIQYCKGTDIKCRHSADICYSSWEKFNKIQRPNSINKNQVLVIPRDWNMGNYGDSYSLSLQKYVLSRDKKKFTFCLFGKDPLWKSWLTENEVDFFEWNPMQEYASFLEEFLKFQVILTARYHGCVFATIYGRASISIDIEPKLLLGAEQNVGLSWAPVYLFEDLDKLIEKAFLSSNLISISNTKNELVKLSELNIKILKEMNK